MADTFKLDIITPDTTVVSEDVDSVECPGLYGEFQVLAGHTPFLTSLGIGPVLYIQKGKQQALSISGGFCEVKQERTVILAHTAETAEQIDRERAEAARDRAQQRLESEHPDIDAGRAEMALKRAMNRINVANM